MKLTPRTLDRSKVTLDTLISFCKRRGFVYPTNDIYGGLNGVYDIGPLGTQLKENIRKAWRTSLQQAALGTILPFEGALLGSPALWQASGHLQNFHDPLIDCTTCKHRFRADDIDSKQACPDCGKTAWAAIREFNLMFQTQLGAATDAATTAYLRPETAQSIFSNFKNIFTSNRVKIPFGVAQMGKAFRNEITPKQFLFRMREFEQMELEWFCTPDSSDAFFKQWSAIRHQFYQDIGMDMSRIRIRPHDQSELSHYSRGTSDVEYAFPFGWKELEGIAHRGDYDLQQHSTCSGKDLSVFDEVTKTSYIPHVIECSVGVDRLFLTLLFDTYDEEDLDGEKRVVLRLTPTLAPIACAIMSLTKQQTETALVLEKTLSAAGFCVQCDHSGSIGKRYRRFDEIGTPWCITVDFDTAQDNTVTIRNRDTMQQERIAMDKLITYIHDNWL
jgi:glycyl-tRNA synthetase